MKSHARPPRIAEWLFRHLFPDGGNFTTIGDLEEVFQSIVESEGATRGAFWYWRQTVKAIPPFFGYVIYWSTAMLRNYFKTTFRHLASDKWYAMINFTGLIVGLTCFALLTLFVQHEFSFDSMHRYADRIYRFVQILDEPGEAIHEASSSIHMAEALMNDFPEVESAAPVFSGMPVRVRYGDKSFVEDNFILSTQHFLQIFDTEFLQGNRETALTAPFSVVITQEAAKKYFPETSPLGKSLAFSRYGDFQVTGVMKDFPANSSLQFSMLLTASFDIYLQDVHPSYPPRFNAWDGRPCTTYALFSKETDPQALEAKLPAFLAKYRGKSQEQRRFYLQNLRDVHLHSTNIQRTFGRLGDIRQLALFSALGVLILLIACVNYANLAAARSTQRAKEVGMRVAVGARRAQIARQFFGESVTMAAFALLPSLLLLDLILPYFNELAQLKLALELKELKQLVLAMLPITVVVGLISGSYPSLFLSRLQPATVLKGVGAISRSSRFTFKRGLVVFQFTISVILIVATIMVQRQLTFLNDKDLGFSSDQLLVIEINDGNVRNNFQTIKNEFLRNSSVLRVAGMSRVISGYRSPPQIEVVVESDPTREPKILDFYGMGQDGMAALGLELMDGRNFDQNSSKNRNVILVNQAAAELFGLDSPVGRTIFCERENYRTEVIGVVKDFHYRSLHEVIRPLAIGSLDNPIQAIDDILVKISPDNMQETVAQLESVYHRFDANQQMDFRFLDSMLHEHYRSEQVFKKVFSLASGLAIFVACLGLIGLAAFSAEQRIREFGIRRVLGASATRIVYLQVAEFLKLVAIANLVGWPIAWLAAEGWLADFSYRIGVNWDVLLLSGLLVTSIAVVTVGAIALRATRMNPVESLRSE